MLLDVLILGASVAAAAVSTQSPHETTPATTTYATVDTTPISTAQVVHAKREIDIDDRVFMVLSFGLAGACFLIASVTVFFSALAQRLWMRMFGRRGNAIATMFADSPSGGGGDEPIDMVADEMEDVRGDDADKETATKTPASSEKLAASVYPVVEQTIADTKEQR